MSRAGKKVGSPEILGGLLALPLVIVIFIAIVIDDEGEGDGDGYLAFMNG